MTIDIGYVVPIIAASIIIPLIVVGYWMLRAGLRNRGGRR